MHSRVHSLIRTTALIRGKRVPFQEYRFLEIAIRQCKSSGIDCKIHGLSISARTKTDEDDLAATFSFLALDEEDEAVRQRRALRKGPSQLERSAEGQIRVFVWGLNDKDQLGGMKGSKVTTSRTEHS